METTTIDVAAALSDVAADIMTQLGSILPIALGIFGAVLAVTFGIKFFKKITGKS